MHNLSAITVTDNRNRSVFGSRPEIPPNGRAVFQGPLLTHRFILDGYANTTDADARLSAPGAKMTRDTDFLSFRAEHCDDEPNLYEVVVRVMDL